MFKVFKNIFITLFIFGLLIAIFVKPESSNTDNIYSDDNYASKDCHEIQSVQEITLTTQRSWIDYSAMDNCLRYNTNLRTHQEIKEKRDKYIDVTSQTYQAFWKNLYSTVHTQNKKAIEPLLDSLWQIKLSRNLNRFEFANTVVSFVQDIPYVYVLDTERCDEQEGNMDCVSGIRYGLLSPYEFLHTLKGDCDTRVLLLYSIFKGFSYHPRIAISNAYEHAVLMLDVASAGDYIQEGGRKYFFWETTATGWQSGILPPDANDINNWEIIL